MNALNENMVSSGREPVTPAERIRADWKHLMARLKLVDFTNHMPYIAFVALLGVIYIANSHRAVELEREYEVQQQKLKEVSWAYKDAKNQLTTAGKEDDILLRGKLLGLNPPLFPAYRIEQTVSPKGNTEEKK